MVQKSDMQNFVQFFLDYPVGHIQIIFNTKVQQQLKRHYVA